MAANTVRVDNRPGREFYPAAAHRPDGNMAEDRVVTVPGFFSASSGPVNSSDQWVMQMVAFRGGHQPTAGHYPADSEHHASYGGQVRSL